MDTTDLRIFIPVTVPLKDCSHVAKHSGVVDQVVRTINRDGLPLGLQLIGSPFGEETLYSLGSVIEQAAGRFTPKRWWA